MNPFDDDSVDDNSEAEVVKMEEKQNEDEEVKKDKEPIESPEQQQQVSTKVESPVREDKVESSPSFSSSPHDDHHLHHDQHPNHTSTTTTKTPWQYDWKSPIWWKLQQEQQQQEEQASKQATKQESSSSSSSSSSLSCLAVTSALVTWEECQYRPKKTLLNTIVEEDVEEDEEVRKQEKEEENKDYKNNDSNDDDDEVVETKKKKKKTKENNNSPNSSSSSSFVLSVTLLSSYSSSTTSTTTTTGTALKLELFYHKNNKNKNNNENETNNNNEEEMTIVTSQILTWPGSALLSETTTKTKTTTTTTTTPELLEAPPPNEEEDEEEKLETKEELDDDDDDDDEKESNPIKSWWKTIQQTTAQFIDQEVIKRQGGGRRRRNNDSSFSSKKKKKKKDQEEEEDFQGLVSITLCRLPPQIRKGMEAKTTMATVDEPTSIANAMEIVNLLSLGGGGSSGSDGNYAGKDTTPNNIKNVVTPSPPAAASGTTATVTATTAATTNVTLTMTGGGVPQPPAEAAAPPVTPRSTKYTELAVAGSSTTESPSSSPYRRRGDDDADPFVSFYSPEEEEQFTRSTTRTTTVPLQEHQYPDISTQLPPFSPIPSLPKQPIISTSRRSTSSSSDDTSTSPNNVVPASHRIGLEEGHDLQQQQQQQQQNDGDASDPMVDGGGTTTTATAIPGPNSIRRTEEDPNMTLSSSSLQQDTNNNDNSNSLTELQLLCVTRSGQVHVYSPLTLLLGPMNLKEKEEKLKKQIEEQQQEKENNRNKNKKKKSSSTNDNKLDDPTYLQSSEYYYRDDDEKKKHEEEEEKDKDNNNKKMTAVTTGITSNETTTNPSFSSSLRPPPTSGDELFIYSMERFFLGETLQDQLQETVWPLCQPITTMSLTSSVHVVPSSLSSTFIKSTSLVQHPPPHKKTTAAAKISSEEDTIEIDQTKKQLFKKKEEKKEVEVEEEKEDPQMTTTTTTTTTTAPFSLWDPILWNPIVEATTAQYKTIHNRPTLSCVAGPHSEYLAVAGYGWRPELRTCTMQRHSPGTRVGIDVDNVMASKDQSTKDDDDKNTESHPSNKGGEDDDDDDDADDHSRSISRDLEEVPSAETSGSGVNWWDDDDEDDADDDKTTHRKNHKHMDSLLPQDGWMMDNNEQHGDDGSPPIDSQQQQQQNQPTSLPDPKRPLDKLSRRHQQKPITTPNTRRNKSQRQLDSWLQWGDGSTPLKTSKDGTTKATATTSTTTTVETTYHEGGFVTLFSLRYFAETKTLYLPFRPCHMSCFEWNEPSIEDDGSGTKFSFLMILGSHPSQAVAICLDAAVGSPRPTSWLPRRPTSHSAAAVSGTASSFEDHPESEMNNHWIWLRKRILSLRRFQALPIHIPHVEENRHGGGGGSQISSRLLAGSSSLPHATDPPAILVAYYEKTSKDHGQVDEDGAQRRPRRNIMIVQRTLQSISPGIGGPFHQRRNALQQPLDSDKDDDAFVDYDTQPPIAPSNTPIVFGMETTLSARHVATIPLDDGDGDGNDSNPLDQLWSYVGQGWCLVGSRTRVYFICWEGATNSRGALCIPIPLEDTDMLSSSSLRISAGAILPLQLRVRPTAETFEGEGGHSIRLSESDAKNHLKRPLTATYRWPHNQAQKHHDVEHTSSATSHGADTADSRHSGALDELVLDALERLSGLSYRTPAKTTVESSESTSSFLSSDLQRSYSKRMASPSRHLALSHREKSQQLLRHCSSWMQLEDTMDNRRNLEGYFPVVSLVLEMETSGEGKQEDTTSGRLFSTPLLSAPKKPSTKSRKVQQYVLSLRQLVVENGSASPFQQVLSWLSTDQQDYFTAASVALDLLHDADTLLHLWKYSDETIDQDEEQTKLQGLLDGIIPIPSISSGPISSPEESPNDLSHLQTSTLTQLADMTVGCLAKGGFPMSKTLQKFLTRNAYYDPARACLMLVATTASAVSEDPEAVAEVMGRRSPSSSAAEYDAGVDDLVWPVRCLLEIGVARNYLSSALLLLNVAIPDELRRRERPLSADHSSDALPSMELCKKLATLIVGSAPNAAELLLGLVDDHSQCRFWQSLARDTRHVLSLIEIESNHTFPLLRHAEVRNWAREELHNWLKKVDLDGSEVQETLPSGWLEKLCVACLQNAGCDLRDLTIESSLKSSRRTVNRPYSAASSLTDEEDGLEQHKQIVLGTRNALMEPSFRESSSFLDFDLLIPCLLLLESRGVAWQMGNFVSTQTLLDAVCYLAGRPSKRKDLEPQFVFDGSTAMQQCVFAGNVKAGGKLVGGTNGFVLSCCDILIRELDMTMEEAEVVMLQERTPIEVIESLETRYNNESTPKTTTEPFALNDAHREILWLMDEHVLSICTYGQFETTHRRGTVDPVFASRCLFRAWLCLITVAPTEKRIGTAWLVKWLRQKLGMVGSSNKNTLSVGKADDKSGTISPHRLVCSAMTRALSWSSTITTTSTHPKKSIPPKPTQSGISSLPVVSLSTPPNPLILANMLQVESQFLIQLAQSCCGLVESVPPLVAEEVLRQAEEKHSKDESLSYSFPPPTPPGRIIQFEDRFPSY